VRLDRITNLCDQLSFNFCFELPASGEVAILPRNDSQTEVPLHYQVEDGVINVKPWPFSVDSYEGYIIGYKPELYPAQLDPVILPFRLEK